MVHASYAVHLLIHVIDLLEDFFIKNVSVLNRQHNIDIVSPAKLGGKLSMHLHEWVAIRQQITKACAHSDAEGIVRHDSGKKHGNCSYWDTSLNEGRP